MRLKVEEQSHLEPDADMGLTVRDNSLLVLPLRDLYVAVMYSVQCTYIFRLLTWVP